MDPGLVIDKDVAIRRVGSEDLGDVVLLVAENVDTMPDTLRDPAHAGFVGLVQRTAVADNRSPAERRQRLQRAKSPRIDEAVVGKLPDELVKSLGEDGPGMPGRVAFHREGDVDDPGGGTDFLVQVPEGAGSGAGVPLAGEPVAQLLLERIVVEERVVEIDEEDGTTHWPTSHVPSGA